MKNFLNPKWMLFVNTIPLLILSFFCYQQFDLITSYLSEENIKYWTYFFTSLAAIGIATLSHSIYLIYKKKQISLKFSLFHFSIFATFFVVFIAYQNQLTPFNVPNWKNSDFVIFQYLGTSIIPTLIYLLLCSIIILMPKKKKQSPALNILYAVIVPAIWFFVIYVILPYWKFRNSGVSTSTMITLVVISTVLFFFFLFRFFYTLFLKKTFLKSKLYQRLFILCIALILPLTALIVYYILFDGEEFLGKFNNFWVYFFTITNGIALLIGETPIKRLNILLYFIKCIGFSFSLYFFLVFVLLVPFSIIAILFFGIGLLLLSPIFLFILQIKEIRKDFDTLKAQISKTKILSLTIIGFLTIPIFMTFSFISDRHTVNQTLEYIYSPNYFKKEKIDLNALENIISAVRNNKNSRREMFEEQLPFISSYYNWIVLDNLTLSEDKLNEIESIFFDKNFKKPQRDRVNKEEVKITTVENKSRFDKEKQVWISL